MKLSNKEKRGPEELERWFEVVVPEVSFERRYTGITVV